MCEVGSRSGRLRTSLLSVIDRWFAAGRPVAICARPRTAWACMTIGCARGARRLCAALGHGLGGGLGDLGEAGAPADLGEQLGAILEAGVDRQLGAAVGLAVQEAQQ